MTEASLTLLQTILENIRSAEHPDFAPDVVARLGEIEDAHLFTNDVETRRSELQRLVDMEVLRRELASDDEDAPPSEEVDQ